MAFGTRGDSPLLQIMRYGCCLPVTLRPLEWNIVLVLRPFGLSILARTPNLGISLLQSGDATLELHGVCSIDKLDNLIQ